jgi:hypothetical protein
VILMLSPDKMPDPWLFDGHFLLAELARVRELILRIPLHLDTFGPTNTALSAVSELEDRLRLSSGASQRGSAQLSAAAGGFWIEIAY